jgi:hypothetical protein
MGLETVELVIRFEEAFGITISDEVATRMTTPHEVTDYIMTQVAVGAEAACLSQQAFYFLRRGFSNRLQMPRRAFRPDTSLQQLIPKQNRKLVWSGLKTEIGGAALPNLSRPLWLFYLLFGSIVLFGFCAFYVMPKFSLSLKVELAIVIALLFGFVASVVTRPLKTDFRRGFRTLGGLVEYLLLHSPHSFKREQRTWTRAQVAETVRAIIVDITGVTNFTEDSHFINDMRLG